VQGTQSTRDRNRIRAARLAPGEALLLAPRDGDGDAISALERAWSYDVPGVWPVPRREASFWFLVVGRHATALFAKICGVDLRAKAFANGAIAQTSVARTNCIIINSSVGDLAAYDLLGDSASSAFVLTSILDAMAEFKGALLGLDALQVVWTAQ
jgi:sarcosine oxidase subunit gamma